METSKDPIIEKWLELNIQRAEFEFYAGGDSMGDTELTFYNDKNQPVTFEYETEIDKMVYDNVEFYVNSDGHYLGEHGVVTIELDDDNEDFIFSKSAMSEYYESVADTIGLQLEEQEYNYLRDYVSEFEDSSSVEDITDGNSIFVYSVDFFKDNELSDIEESILAKIKEACNGHSYEQESGRDIDEDDINISDLDLKEDNKIDFNVNYHIYIERESD
jgi:hypothetical protein